MQLIYSLSITEKPGSNSRFFPALLTCYIILQGSYPQYPGEKYRRQSNLRIACDHGYFCRCMLTKQAADIENQDYVMSWAE